MATSLKGKIEAILFMTGRALSIADIGEKVHAPHDDVEEALLELIQDYSFREESSLEIDDADGYILQVKSDYSSVVNQMIPVELSTAALRTLSAIAIQGPLLQSSLIDIRGSAAYDHIKELSTNGLVYKRRKDRTFTLGVTPKFHQYFKLTGDKNELRGLMGTLATPEPQPEAALDEDAPLMENIEPAAS